MTVGQLLAQDAMYIAPAQTSSGENSRRKVQNVLADRSAYRRINR